MPETCSRSFDESLLSGFLDGALTQADAQQVRIHLEDCPICQELVADMERLREATMTTSFAVPTDDQWNEKPRGPLSRLALTLGGLVLILWLVGMGGFVLGQLWTGSENLTEKLIVFGGISGVVLLFLSVLIDRWKTRKTDRYREVEK